MWAVWCVYADFAIVTAAFLVWWLWRHPPPDAKPLRWWDRLAVSVMVGALWPLFWIDAPNLLGIRRDP